MRPKACNGCPACPGSAGYDPRKTGAFVPPILPLKRLNDPEGLLSADLMHVDLVIIGTAPGFREVDAGEPLSGPAFAEMRRGLGPLLDTTRIMKLNYFNCRPWKPGKTVDFVNRDPKAIESKACALRWLVPILRAMARAEQKGANIHLWVLGQKAFDVVFQGKYGTFAGSKGSRGQRMNRRKEGYDVLADRVERWATKESKKKARFCTGCQQPLTVPRVRLCPTCRVRPERERGKPVVASVPERPSSEAPLDLQTTSLSSPQEHPPDGPASPRQLELPGCSSRPSNRESDES